MPEPLNYEIKPNLSFTAFTVHEYWLDVVHMKTYSLGKREEEWV